jgi:hypothetical protein
MQVLLSSLEFSFNDMQNTFFPPRFKQNNSGCISFFAGTVFFSVKNYYAKR